MSPEEQELACSNLDYLLSQTEAWHHQKMLLDPTSKVQTLSEYSQVIQPSKNYPTIYYKGSILHNSNTTTLQLA